MGLGKGKRIVGFVVSSWDLWERGLVLEIEGEFQNAKLLHLFLVVFDPLLSQLLVPALFPFFSILFLLRSIALFSLVSV